MTTEAIAQPVQTQSPRGVLLYVGANVGDGAARLVPQHETSILVEADPWCADVLSRRFAAEIHEGRVVVVCGAALPMDILAGHETQTLRRYNDRSGSASIAPISDEGRSAWPNAAVETAPRVMVGGVHLYELLANGLEILELRTLVTDAQGADFGILQSLAYWVDKGIATIQCEVDADGFESYRGRANHHSLFTELFDESPCEVGTYMEVWNARGAEGTPDALQYDVRWQLVAE